MADARLEEIDQQIDLLETLRELDTELKDFSSWLDALTKGPKTGDLSADYEIGQLRDLLIKMSDQLGHYTAPLSEASDLAGRISGLVTAVDAISAAAADPDAPPDELVTALGDFIGGLNAALPLFGEVFAGLNPVIGVYFLLLGEMIKGIARSVRVIAGQVEVRNEAIDLFDDVIEGRYDQPGQEDVDEGEAQAALDAELTELYLRRARLERQIRETDYRNALRICLRDRNQTESMYEADLAELEVHEAEWAELTTIGSFRELTTAEHERVQQLTDMIDRRRAQVQEVERCVRGILERYAPTSVGAALGGCLWALIPFLLVSVVGITGLFVLRDDTDAVVDPAASGTSTPTSSSPTSSSSSSSSTSRPEVDIDDLVAEYGPVARILADAGAPPAVVAELLGRFVTDDDAGVPRFVFSMEGVDVTENGAPSVDVVDWYLGELDTETLPGLTDSAFPCGIAADRAVACPDPPIPFPDGPVVVAAMRLAGSVPLTGVPERYVYAAVFETDGAPDTDWMPRPPYDWDYFQGADRWFEGIGAPDQSRWDLSVRSVSSDQQPLPVPSSARLVVEGDAVVFFVPATEVATADRVCGRLSAFRHDGSFSPDSSAGDLGGGAPTAPLFGLDGAPC